MEPINVNESVWKDKQGLKKEIEKVEKYAPKSLMENPVEMFREAGEVWRETHEMSESLSLLGELDEKIQSGYDCSIKRTHTSAKCVYE